MDYFELLDLEKNYDINQNLLNQKYLHKQSVYHPDRAGNEAERKEFLEKSMVINEAYNTLKDDYLRAEYLLKQNGQKFDDISLKNKLSPSDIENLIEDQEKVSDTDSIEDLQAFYKEKLSEKSLIIKELKACFKNNNMAMGLDITIKLKYLTNLVRNIKLKIQHADNRDI